MYLLYCDVVNQNERERERVRTVGQLEYLCIEIMYMNTLRAVPDTL